MGPNAANTSDPSGVSVAVLVAVEAAVAVAAGVALTVVVTVALGSTGVLFRTAVGVDVAGLPSLSPQLDATSASHKTI